jgi:hypothetical protein
MPKKSSYRDDRSFAAGNAGPYESIPSSQGYVVVRGISGQPIFGGKKVMSVLCPGHYTLGAGDLSMCDLHVCAMENSCPYPKYKTTANKVEERSDGGPLYACSGIGEYSHELIYLNHNDMYVPCPLCRSLYFSKGKERIQAKLREKLREKIAKLEGEAYSVQDELRQELHRAISLLHLQKGEIKRLKKVVLMNHEEMERLRAKVVNVDKPFKEQTLYILQLQDDLREERTRRIQAEEALVKQKPLDDVPELKISRNEINNIKLYLKERGISHDLSSCDKITVISLG